MTDHDPVLLVIPRQSWDSLVGATDPTVRQALDSLVQVDDRVHVAIRTIDGIIEDVVVSVHLDSVEATVECWADEGDDSSDMRVAVRSVPIGLARPEEVS